MAADPRSVLESARTIAVVGMSSSESKSAFAVPATLWLQKGIVSEEARSIAEAGGLAYVENLCMGVERSRYGITKP